MLRQQIKRREKQGQVTTVRDFKGGWNVVDNEFNMAPKYARVLRNAIRQNDGTIGPRWGTEWFASIESLGIGKILNIEFFSTYIVGVTTRGVVFAVNGQGTIFQIWNEAIAHSRAGSPHSWTHASTADKAFVSLTPFKGKLIICNGIDKPLFVDKFLTCNYLYDLATGSNVNTPIGRYAAAAVGDDYGYLVIAGDPLNPSTLHIGHADVIGTFLGDGAPNDAVQYNLSAKVTNGSDIIRGLKFYRDRLIVGFDEVVIAVQLGLYSGTTHTPQVTDVIEGFGCVGHRTMSALVEDIFMANNYNVNYITRAKLSTSLVGENAGELIQPELQGALQSLSEATLEDRVFAVNNHNEQQWMLFVPNHDDRTLTTESKGFIYTAGRPGAWSEARHWNWRAGCTTLQNNVFFADDYNLYRYGKEASPLYRDYVDDHETFSDGTKFTDHTGLTPIADATESGIPITWAWELPWADFDKRMTLKRSQFLSVDATGAGRFTVDMYIDDLYLDPSDPGEAFIDGYLFTDDTGFERVDPLTIPALSQEFVGGGRGGFGEDSFGELFGGGLRSNLPKNFRWPARYKLAKLRFSGDTDERLRIAAFSIAYNIGGLRR